MFSTPWLAFVDSMRIFVLVAEVSSSSLLLWLMLTTKPLRLNRAWISVVIVLIFSGYGVTYTEWSRLGQPVGHHGRLWAFSIAAVFRMVFVYYSFTKLRRSRHGTLMQRAIWEQQREELTDELKKERAKNAGC